MRRFNQPIRIDVLLAIYYREVILKRLSKLDEEIFNE